MKKRSPGSREGKDNNHLLKRMREDAAAAGHSDLLLNAPLVVGVSGGPDSVALLHALVQLRGDSAPDTLQVAHFNHGLRGEEGDADARLVEKLGREWSIPVITGSGDVPRYAREHKLSTEDAARRLRYLFLKSVALKSEGRWAVAVAHTAGDQAETVLMSIMRGSGLSGLAGMQIVGEIPDDAARGGKKVTLFRPMLGVWREDVLAHLSEHAIPYAQDATNDDLRFTRNRVRRELLPLMERDYNPAAAAHLVTLARLTQLEDSLIKDLVDEAWPRVAVAEPAGGAIRLDAQAFRKLHQALQFRVVREAVARLTGSTRDLDFHHTQESARLITSPQEGEVPLPHDLVAEHRPYWSGIRTRSSSASARAAVEKYAPIWPMLAPGSSVNARLDQPTGLDLGWSCEIVVTDAAKVGYSDYTAAFDPALTEANGIVIRSRRPGDRISPLGMEGSKSLKDLYVDAKIPRAIRDRVAVVADAATGEVLWVPGPGGVRSRTAIIAGGTARVLRVRFFRSEQE